MPDEALLELRESSSIAEAASKTLRKPDGTEIQLGYNAAGDYTGDGSFDDQGRVPLFVIRPGLGKGKGRHLYEASMLRENAHKFQGWRMFINHLSPEARKALGGLPRDILHTGGLLKETWFDDSVPANGRHDQGAVVGLAKVTPQIRDLIDTDPALVEASISATATGVKPRDNVQGGRAWVVEGIEDRGSVDWVSEAGAGGQIVSIVEAALAADPDGHLALLASMSDDEVTEHLRSERPELLEALGTPGTHPKGTEENRMPEKTAAELLQEALSSDEGRDALLESLNLESTIEEAVQETLSDTLPGIFQQALSQTLPTLLAEALEEEREVMRATASADADRRVQITEMRSTAHEMISGTRLPEPFKADLRARFDIKEGQPTAHLNVVDDIDDDGAVTKAAEDKLRESVTTEIKHMQQLHAAANPTRVTAQGPSGGDGEGEAPKAGSVPKGTLAADLLSEAGFSEEQQESLYSLNG